MYPLNNNSDSKSGEEGELSEVETEIVRYKNQRIQTEEQMKLEEIELKTQQECSQKPDMLVPIVVLLKPQHSDRQERIVIDRGCSIHTLLSNFTSLNIDLDPPPWSA